MPLGGQLPALACTRQTPWSAAERHSPVALAQPPFCGGLAWLPHGAAAMAAPNGWTPKPCAPLPTRTTGTPRAARRGGVVKRCPRVRSGATASPRLCLRALHLHCAVCRPFNPFHACCTLTAARTCLLPLGSSCSRFASRRCRLCGFFEPLAPPRRASVATPAW